MAPIGARRRRLRRHVPVRNRPIRSRKISGPVRPRPRRRNIHRRSRNIRNSRRPIGILNPGRCRLTRHSRILSRRLRLNPNLPRRLTSSSP